jgi:hypothetical protein
MKQAENNNVEAHLISVTGYLRAMSEDTRTSKMLLDRLSTVVDNLHTYLTTQAAILNEQAAKSNNDSGASANSINIQPLLQRFDMFYKRWEETLLFDTPEITTNNLLNQILTHLVMISSKMVEGKSKKVSIGKKGTITKNEVVASKKRGSGQGGIPAMTVPAIKLYLKLLTLLKDRKVGKSLESFAGVLKLMATKGSIDNFKKLVKEADKFIKKLSRMNSLYAKLKSMQKRNYWMGIGVGLFAIAGALVLFRYVKWQSVALFLAFLVALSLVTKLFMVKGKVDKISTAGIGKWLGQKVGNGFDNMAYATSIAIMFIGLGIGILIMAGAMKMLSPDDMVSSFILITFILGLGLALRVGGNRYESLIKLGEGMIVVILAMLMVSLISINSVGIFIGLMLVIGITMRNVFDKKLEDNGAVMKSVSDAMASFVKTLTLFALISIISTIQGVGVMIFLALTIVFVSRMYEKADGLEVMKKFVSIMYRITFVLIIFALIPVVPLLKATSVFVAICLSMSLIATSFKYKQLKGLNRITYFITLVAGVMVYISSVKLSIPNLGIFFVGLFLMLGFVYLLGIALSKFKGKAKKKTKPVEKAFNPNFGKKMKAMMINLLIFSAGLLLIATSFFLVSKVTGSINWVALAIFFGVVAVLFGLIWLVGFLKLHTVMVGAAMVFLLLGVILLTLSLAMLILVKAINSLDMTKLVDFAVGIKMLIVKLAEALYHIFDALLVSILLIVLGIALIFVVAGMWLVSKLSAEIDFEPLKKSVRSLIDALTKDVGVGEVFGALGVALAIMLVSIFTFVAILLMMIISLIPPLSFLNLQMSITNLLSVYTMSFEQVGIALGLSVLIMLIAIFSLVIAITMVVIVGVSMLISLSLLEVYQTAVIKLYTLYTGMDIGLIAIALAVTIILLIIAVITIVIAVALLAVVGIAAVISPTTMTTFKSSVISLYETYKSLNFISLLKGVGKSIVLMPMALTTIKIAEALKALGEVNVTPAQLQTFKEAMLMFVQEIGDAVHKSKDKLVEIKPALEAFATLVNVAGSLVEVVKNFASMQFNVYGVDKDGNVKVVEIRKIDPEKDFPMVGKNIGRLITALIEPLQEISSDKKKWNFGGLIMDNPFKGGLFGDNNKGTDRIKKIAEAYLPLSEILKNLSSMEIVTNKEAYERFQNAMGISIQTVVDSVKKIGDIDPKTLTERTTMLETFSKSISEFASINTPANSLIKLIDMLADQNVWNKVNSNIDRMGSNIRKVVESINKINDKKAALLYDNLRIMSEAKSREDLIDALNKLCEIIGLLTDEKNSPFKNNNPQPEQQRPAAYAPSSFGGSNASSPAASSVSGETLTQIKVLLETLPSTLAQGWDAGTQKVLDAIDKLSQKIFTVQVDKNENDIHTANALR